MQNTMSNKVRASDTGKALFSPTYVSSALPQFIVSIRKVSSNLKIDLKTIVLDTTLDT